VALLDAVKAIAMFRKVHIEVLGLVENMSFFECPGCGGRYEIFGSGGAKRRAEELDVPFLGELPINIQLRIRGDEGQTAANFEDPVVSKYLHEICLNLVKNLVTGRKEQPALPTLSVL
jgi:ATP-binding protein involved in chromosome partitioning